MVSIPREKTKRTSCPEFPWPARNHCLLRCLILLSLYLAVLARVFAGVASPAAGDSWAAASTHVIRWKPLPGEDNVSLSLSCGPGSTWTEIAHTVPNTGSYLWKIAAPESKSCHLRVGTQQSGVFHISSSQEVPAYRWINVTMQAPFAPRDGAGALTFAGRMFLIGGWNPKDKLHFPRICVNDVWSSPDGAAWTLVKPNTFRDPSFDPDQDWEGRHTAGYVIHRGKMWIVGGDPIQKHYQYDVWSSSDGKTWRQAAPGHPVPWGPRALHYTVAFHDRIWVIGGQTLPSIAAEREIFYRDVWNTEDGVQWRKLTPVEPYWSPRGMIGGGAVFRDRIWILGGGTYDTPTTPKRNFYNDVWSSADGTHWTREVAEAPWAPRQYHDVAVFDGRLWVMEGYAGANRNDVWYTADGVNWYEVPETPWKPRHAASVFVHAGALWMIAGNNMESDVWKLVGASAKH